MRKYIYGARVDEPVCMIDVADSNAVYYYHFDGLGSVVALSDSNGDSVQSYEYSAYGQVAAEDPNHPNPYMFTGRRFDIETGLYYYRARYYNPHIGRFMQTDPVGYVDGINWYLYCGNNPLAYTDPSGLGADYNEPNEPNTCEPNEVWEADRGIGLWEEEAWSSWGPWIGFTTNWIIPKVNIPPGFYRTLKVRSRTQRRHLVWYTIYKVTSVDAQCNTTVRYESKREGIVETEIRYQIEHQSVWHFMGRIFYKGEIVRGDPSAWMKEESVDLLWPFD